MYNHEDNLVDTLKEISQVRQEKYHKLTYTQNLK